MLILNRGVSIVNGLLALTDVYGCLVRMFLLRCSTAERLTDVDSQKVNIYNYTLIPLSIYNSITHQFVLCLVFT